MFTLDHRGIALTATEPNNYHMSQAVLTRDLISSSQESAANIMMVPTLQMRRLQLGEMKAKVTQLEVAEPTLKLRPP